MSNATVEPIGKAATDAAAKLGKSTEHMMQANQETLASSSTAALNGLQELTKAYQALATRNAERLTASIQELAAVKTPAQFFELQRKLMTEGIEAAVNDGGHIAKLTAAVFAGAFEPVQKQFEALQSNLKH